MINPYSQRKQTMMKGNRDDEDTQSFKSGRTADNQDSDLKE